MEDRDDESDQQEDGDQQELENEEQKKSRSKDAEAGILEKIILKDFMCHKHLEVPFGPNINFVIGENGSGKSAILVGLAVCLGAKTTFTNRGSKMGDLVRSGMPSATVTVYIRNRGSEAFRHGDFGDSIIVERKLMRAGSSQYRLKSASGKEVSKSRRDLVALLDHFNMQVDNPCAVLMQDTSRQFLTESSPKDKYKFFTTGTQLEQLKRDMMYLKDALERMFKVQQEKEAQLPELKRRVEDLQTELESLQNIDQLQREISELRTALAWAAVHTDEVKLENVEKELRAAQADIKKHKQMYDLKQAALKDAREGTQADKQKKIQNLSKELAEIRQKKSEAEKKVIDFKKEQTKRSARMKDLTDRISKHQGRISRLEKDLKKQRDDDASARKRVKDQRAADQKEKEKNLAELQQALTTLQAEIEQAQNEVNDISTRLGDLGKSESEVKKEQYKVDGRLRAMQQAHHDKMAKFGPKIPELLKQIATEKRWHKPPVGPIGAYITLKDSTRAAAIESQLKNLLKNFMVHDEHDHKLFHDLCIKIGSDQVPVVQQAFDDKRYDIPASSQPPPELLTIYRAVDVSSPWVLNGLVDQAAIERTVLADTDEQAVKLLRQHESINFCVLPDGSTIRFRRGTRMLSDQKYHPSVLGVDEKQVVRELTEVMKKLSEDLKALQQQQAEANNDMATVRKAIQTKMKERSKLETQISSLENEIQTIKMQEADDAKPSDAPDLGEHLKVLTAELHKFESDREALQAEDSKLKSQVEPYLKAVSDATAEAAQRTKDLEDVREEITDISKTIDSLNTESDRLQKLAAEASVRAEQLERSVKQLNDSIAANSKSASKLGERPPRANEPMQHLQNELKGKQRTLESEQANKRPLEIVRSEHLDALTKCRQLEESMTQLKGLITDLQVAGNERHARWRRWRKDISTRTRKYFNIFLTQKGHAGTILFDHEDCTLSVEVQIDMLKQSESRDSRSLSGGEKSYATLALLLAIWETMDTPFRAMDEFDVFMDAVRRTVSIELLITVAKQYRNRQFIFITPQDPSAIHAAKEVRIFKMQPPDRSQKASQRLLNLNGEHSQ